MTNKLSAVLLTFLLSACVTKTAQFYLPEQVEFDGKSYVKVTHNHIDAMQQSLYLERESSRDSENWQKGILLFLDTNPKMGLAERTALRQKAFAKQKETVAKVELVGQELQSQVIYPPTERFQNYQLEVTRGRPSQCGFSQMQFSDKRSVSAKNSQNLTAYQQDLSKLTQQFAQLAWQIACK